MIRASISRRTSGVTNGTPAFELIAGPTRPIWLREVQVILAAATASTYGLGRPAAKGVGPTTPVAPLLEEGGDVKEVQSLTAVAWTTTAPTAPVNFFRQVGFPNVIASDITWTFRKGLYIPADGSIVLWNLGTNGVVDVIVTIDEVQG